MNLKNILSTGMGISNNDVTFHASLIDEFRHGVQLGRSQVKKSKPDLAGKSENASLMAELKRTWYKDRNFELQKQELSGSTFYIMDQKTLDPPTNISGQLSLVMSILVAIEIYHAKDGGKVRNPKSHLNLQHSKAVSSK